MNGLHNCRPLIVQVIPKEKFTKGFILFTNDAFPNKDIQFIVYGDDKHTGYRKFDAPNAVFIDSLLSVLNNQELCQLLNRCNLVIFNSALSSMVIVLVFRKYLNKAIILFWGNDIYSRQISVSPFWKPRAWINRKSLIYMIKASKGVSTLIPGDLEKIDNLATKHGKWYLGCMPGGSKKYAELRKLDALSAINTPKPVSPLRILMGNSATSTNRHEEIIEALAHFANENIKIYAPLSYGDSLYRDKIINKGVNIFGDKFMPLVDFMSESKYIDFLKTISIGVFNYNRQQGMGNINTLTLFGAKVYLARDNPMWKDFNDQSRIFYDFSDISQISFAEFVEFDKTAALKNFEILDPIRAYDDAVCRWSKIYSAARN